MSQPIEPSRARAIFIQSQGLDAQAPFGSGPAATQAAVEHLGYVQIDSINVIERCHHHILFNRIPTYRRADLAQAQSVDKSVFEYWTHALSYVPTRDLRFFLPQMRQYRRVPGKWFSTVDPKDVRRMLGRIRDEGALSIRDVEDDVLVDKDHPWASRKPSKGALQLAFFDGRLTVNARSGMLKSYELTERHFGWEQAPRPATDNQVNAYLLDRALRSQGIVSLDSICHLEPSRKPAIRPLIEARVKRKTLVPVHLAGLEKTQHWIEPQWLEAGPLEGEPRAHILSPFDPLVIQRKRLEMLFGYVHRFEAYLPANKRVLGYFALPVLIGDKIVAALDLKTDRKAGTLLVQKWTSFTPDTAGQRQVIEEALHRFETFQLAA